MKPIKLVLQAFGPFKDRIEINFEQFEHHSLFLITGATGSGKSSIFDALLYALYGQVSHPDKNGLTHLIKSQYASDEELCFVELTFSSQQEIYTIYRQPKQKTLGKFGRIISPEAMVRLSHPTFVLEKENDVRQKIQTLLGLNVDQFKQIVLLPQGEFKKLLTSSSTEKEVIFRELFQTQGIEQFTLKLKEKADELKTQRIQSQELISNYLSQINFQAEGSTNEEILPLLYKEEKQLEAQFQNNTKLEEQVSLQLLQINQQLELEQKIGTTKKRLDSLDQQKESMQQLEASIQKMTQILNIRPLYQEVNDQQTHLQSQVQKLDETKIELSLNTTQLQECLKKQKQNQEALKEMPQHQESIKLNQEQLYAIKQKQRLLNQQQNLMSEAKDLKTRLNNLLIQNKETDESIKTTAENLKSIIQDLELLNGYKIILPQLEAKGIQLNQKSQLLERGIHYRQQHQTLLENFNQAQHLLLATQQREADMKQLYYHQQAGLLAIELKDDQPCPVCGSLHHPSPAELSHNSITKEQLDQQNEAVVEATQTFATIQEKLNLNLEQLKQILAQFNLEGHHLEDGLNETKAQLVSLDERQKQLHEALSTFDQKSAEKEALEQKISQLQKQSQTYQQQQTQLASYLERNQDQQSRLELELTDYQLIDVNQENKIELTIKTLQHQIEQVHQAEKQLLVESKDLEAKVQLKKQIVSDLERNNQREQQLLTKKMAMLEEALLKADCQLTDLSLNIDEIEIAEKQSKIESYHKQVQQHETLLTEYEKQFALFNPRVDAPNDVRFNLMQQKVKLTQDIRLTFSKLENLRNILQRLNHEIETLNHIESDLRQLIPLVDVALGNKENQYLSFERYVLGTYFMEVLNFANQRFYEMSAGRYELVVAEEVESRKRSSGLDLEVFDYYTSQRRSVKSLSGGETFNASLALALGLSDVISNQSGGVEIETLFIDEGFGSLDSLTLDLAIETLFKLNQAGRLIGIISHVSELKERIDAQIQVIKSQTGSTIQIIN